MVHSLLYQLAVKVQKFALKVLSQRLYYYIIGTAWNYTYDDL